MIEVDLPQGTAAPRARGLRGGLRVDVLSDGDVGPGNLVST